MENFFARYKNPLVLMAVLFIQVIALATQVKRSEGGPAAGKGTRLIRVWTVTAFTPIEKFFISTGHFFRDGWHNYADLRSVRRQNEQLQQEIERLRMEQVRLRQDADQARRLQALLEFRQKFVDKTVTAQVIATSGTEQSRVITIDKGSRDGLKTDMAVITPDGIVGKVKDVFPLSSQVLLINDHDSGAGVILESSRLQGVLKGTSLGELQIAYVMADEKVEAGEHVITSGGDRVYPKGLSVGTVISASADRDSEPYLNIKIKPAADLGRLEEVLVITKMAEETPVASGSSSLRAADILSQQLPSVPKVDPNAAKSPGGAAATANPIQTPKPTASPTPKPLGAAGTEPKKENPVGGTAVKAPSTTNTTPTAKTPATTAKTVSGPSATAQPSPATVKKPENASAQNGSAGAKPGGSPSPTPTPKPRAPAPGANAGGSPTPTPTPKPKSPAAKKTKTATPGDVSPSKPEGTSEPAATPTPSQEKPPR